MMRGVRAGCIAIALATVFSACSEPAATEPLARGRQLYRQLDCGRCHQLAGQGGRVGPELTRIGAVAEERRPADPTGYLRESLTDPGNYVVPGFTDVMPRGLVRGKSAFDVDSLVAYLNSLR